MPDEHSKAQLDKMMDRVRKLLERADHPNTPAPEAATCREQAERIMTKYRIEEEHLIASGDLKTDVISVQSFMMDIGPIESEFLNTYRTMASYAVHHTGCRGVYKYDFNRPGGGMMIMEVFGYEADIRYSEALYNAARLLFADRMEPKPDPTLSDEDNVYRMRSAGMERIRIAALMGYGDTTSATSKVTRLYKKACAARGEEATLTGKGNSVKDFRSVYADEFKSTFWWRLHQARNAVEAEIEGSGLVLANREDRINEAMYNKYPHLRPKESVEYKDTRTPKQKEADERRAERERLKQAQKRYSTFGRAGASAGRKAADEINIKGQTPKRRLSN
jgi:hypothetical protein